MRTIASQFRRFTRFPFLTAYLLALSSSVARRSMAIEVLQSFDPATGELLGELPIASNKTVLQVVSNARRAQKEWAKYSLSDRVAKVRSAYETITTFEQGISQLLSMEMGKDLGRASGEVRGALQSGPYYAQEAAQAFQPVSLSGGGTQYYQPLGVVGIISPWNYPVMMANNLIVPALIAGNVVVLKPSEQTPLVADAFFQKLSKALPEHVLTLVHGDGEVGRHLVDSDIQMIAFTGSQATGRDIMSRAAPKLKRLVMELGGNDPMIVMNDANLDRAARFAVAGGFENSGQMCTSMERVYVDERIAAEFEMKVAKIASQYRVGPWDDPAGAQMLIGPIINTKQHDRIVEHLKDAKEKGGRFLVGSSEQESPFITPTIICDMTPGMKMEKEETFGPVIGISSFSSVDEAIARANDSDYGLGAVVFGHDRVQEVAQALEVGMVGINQGQGGGGGPWVGAKQSGFGYHGTKDGHRQFAQVKVITGRHQ